MIDIAPFGILLVACSVLLVVLLRQGRAAAMEGARAANELAALRVRLASAEAAQAEADAREAASVSMRAAEREALRQIGLPLWRRDAALRLVDCNPAFAAAVEADPPTAIAEGRMLGGPAVARRVHDLAFAARKASAPQRVELHVVVGGERRLLEITEAPLADGGTIGVAVDISAREALQVELRRVVAAHADVLENLQTAIAVFGADRRLRFFNAAFARLWRLDEAWLRETPDYGAVLEALREQRRLPEYADFRDFKRQRLRLFTELIEPMEELIWIPDGTTLRARILPHPLGGLLFTFEDVTDNLALERSYNTLMAVQRETIDNLQEGIAVIGSDARLKLWNPAFERLWGFGPGEIAAEMHVGQMLDLKRGLFAAEADWPGTRDRLIARLTERAPRRERGLRGDGRVVERSSVPLPDGAVLHSYVDATDTARVEEALQLRAAALDTAERLKSEFLASVSYELRTPLNGIIGFTEILANQYFGPLNPRQMEYCRDIISASHRLLTIINDILDLASIEAGRMVLQRAPADASALLDGTVQVMGDLARAGGKTLRVLAPPDLPPLDVDARRVKQALCNLVSNALKFTPVGADIALEATRDTKGSVALSVRDTGPGIPEEDQERVFGAFERGRAQGRDGQGAGLGLSLVRRIVELHGGQVSLASTEGEGTCVTCLLPSVDGPG